MNNVIEFGEFSIEIGQGSMVADNLHIPGEVKRDGVVVGDYIAVFCQPDADLVNFRIRPLGSSTWTKSTDSYDDAFDQLRQLL